MIKGVPLSITKEDLAARYVPVTDFEDRTIRALATMTPRSKLFRAIKRELTIRGHWKNKARRIPRKSELDRFKDSRFVPSSMYSKDTQQVSGNSGGFSDGL